MFRQTSDISSDDIRITATFHDQIGFRVITDGGDELHGIKVFGEKFSQDISEVATDTARCTEEEAAWGGGAKHFIVADVVRSGTIGFIDGTTANDNDTEHNNNNNSNEIFFRILLYILKVFFTSTLVRLQRTVR